MVLVWVAVVLWVMTNSMLEVAADCLCTPATANLCLGDNLNVIANGPNAATLTTLTCSDMPVQPVPTTIGLLINLQSM